MKKTKYYQYIFSFVSLLCLICFLFCPLCGYKEESFIDFKANGLELTFGLKENNYPIYYFNYVGLVVMAFLITSVILPCFINLKRKKLIFILTIITMATSIFLVLSFPLTIQHYSISISNSFIALAFIYIIAAVLFINCLMFIYFYIKFIKNSSID